jgi:hypothetical protein
LPQIRLPAELWLLAALRMRGWGVKSLNFIANIQFKAASQGDLALKYSISMMLVKLEIFLFG